MRVDEPVQHVEVMSIRFGIGAGLCAEPGPDVGEQGILPQKFAALVAAHPAEQTRAGVRLQQSRALVLCNAQAFVEVGCALAA